MFLSAGSEEYPEVGGLRLVIRANLEGVESRGGDAVAERGVLWLHSCGIEQPLPIGQLVRPHDVQEGRAKSVKCLSSAGHLFKKTKQKKTRMIKVLLNLESIFKNKLSPNQNKHPVCSYFAAVLYRFNITITHPSLSLTRNSISTELPTSSKVLMALSPLTAPLKNSWRGWAWLWNTHHIHMIRKTQYLGISLNVSK